MVFFPQRFRGWYRFSLMRGIPNSEKKILLDILSEADPKEEDEFIDVFLSRFSSDVKDDIISLYNEVVFPDDFERTLNRHKIDVIVYADKEYPARLRQIAVPPPVLYIKGRKIPHGDPRIAVVGSRKPSVYGRKVAWSMACGLSEAGITVVSGLARGIDGIAHDACLSKGGYTVAVLACGLDMVYPPEHDKLLKRICSENGTVVSEHPPGTPPKRGYFPLRNRIMSGLSDGVLVVEADLKSGTLITAAAAIDQGRELFAVPGNIDSRMSRGCNRLISRGAKAVCHVSDITEELELKYAFSKKTAEDFDNNIIDNITDDENTVLRSFPQTGGLRLDELLEILNDKVDNPSEVLLRLELRGLLGIAPDGIYYLKRPVDFGRK